MAKENAISDLIEKQLSSVATELNKAEIRTLETFITWLKSHEQPAFGFSEATYGKMRAVASGGLSALLYRMLRRGSLRLAYLVVDTIQSLMYMIDGGSLENGRC